MIQVSRGHTLVLSITFLAALAACTSGDRPEPLSKVDIAPPVEVPPQNNVNINNPTLVVANNFEVSADDTLALVWSDEFDGAQLDPEVWFFEEGDGSQYDIPGWGNGELQYYLPDNASLEDGLLKIEAREESNGPFNYTSARSSARQWIRSLGPHRRSGSSHRRSCCQHLRG